MCCEYLLRLSWAALSISIDRFAELTRLALAAEDLKSTVLRCALRCAFFCRSRARGVPEKGLYDLRVLSSLD